MTNYAQLAWFRLTRRRGFERSSLIALALVLGVLGGVGLASIAGARATDDSYRTLLARSDPSAVSLNIGSPIKTSAFSKIPGVTHVGVADETFFAVPLTAKGTPFFGSGIVVPEAGLDGEFFTQDRVGVVQGRLANPHRADEFMATALGERLMGWHVGSVIKMGIYTLHQTGSKGFGTTAVPPSKIIYEHLVGTIVFDNGVVEDSADQLPTYYVLTPAAAKGDTSGFQYVEYNFALRASANVTTVVHDIERVLPQGETFDFDHLSAIEGEVNRSVRPVALALGVFGALALLAALLVGLQMIARRLSAQRSDQEIMRALGAGRPALLFDAILAPILATLAGMILALIIATGLSSLTLLGPVRPLLHEGTNFDVSILLGAAALLFVILAGVSTALAMRRAPGRNLGSTRGRSSVTRLATRVGLPASAATGIGFAFESGSGQRSVPVRSVLVGITIAVTLLASTLTFAGGLSALISRPALYGWNWNYALTSGNEVPSKSLAVLEHYSREVEWSGVNFADVQIDGVSVPVLISSANPAVAPPMLAGHDVRAANQIVLGASTMAALHKRVGETVEVSYGEKHDYPAFLPPTKVTIVGSATLPAVGSAGTFHPSMGVGGIVDGSTEPVALRKAIRSQQLLGGDDMYFVRLRHGVSREEGLAIVNKAARAGDAQFAAVPNNAGQGDTVSVLRVQYPAEIINYRSMGSTPLWLALAFAIGMTIAFGLTVTSSVRLRRRDLALLKTLGFTRRQIRSCISWQASAAVATGVIIGIPLGILLGRELWTLFAREIYAVPFAAIPTVSLVVLGVGALVLANLVALVPQHLAASTPAAIALRAE
ncbi:MAG TPA: FtsX-like permease family protein [Acidimicrobiales bacterium]|nr:FtsX-like permease family protein [Acidimicrobiales bacterium]